MNYTNGFWQDRRVLVTGCTGLVGAWTVHALVERGAHVVGLVRDQTAQSELVRGGLWERIDLVHGRVENRHVLERALDEYEIQTVFHLAAQTGAGAARRNPLSTFETNIRGTWCVLEAARRCGPCPQVILVSSDRAYGKPCKQPWTEETPLLGRHPYEASKACGDILAETYHCTYQMPVGVARCGDFFGGGDLSWNRLIPGTIRAALRGEQPVIRSENGQVRDYFYVKDAAHAFLHLAERMDRQPEVSGQVFNFALEIPLCAVEMVHRILRLMKSCLEPDIRGEVAAQPRQLQLSTAKAEQLLHWAPRYTLDTALRETIEWYQDYFGFLAGQRGTEKEKRKVVFAA